nr:alpha-amylase family glycosyl hydrolase [Neobacillus sp. Marseille-Q6967]
MKKTFITLILIFSIIVSAVPAQAEIEKTNRLWQDETVYSIMVDRFNNGNTENDFTVNTLDPLAYNGGDFQGIINKLDYLKDMGFTAIRLTSIFENSPGGYHGYWVTNHYKPEEHFGSIKTFKKLVNEAHQRGMKVMIDFAANNVSQEHPWVNDSTKADWFITGNKENTEQPWGNELPDLNQENPEVKMYLIDAAKWWIKNTDIDGYSLPEVNDVPIDFWTDFATEVKREKAEFFLLGVPADKNVDTQDYIEAGIDSIMDYQHSNLLRNMFAATDQSMGEEKNVQGIAANFFDNEYTTRFTSDIVEKRQFPGSRWKTALTYSYSTPGIPFVFYGSEIALNGGEIPDNLGPMNFRTEKELIEYITKLGELRNQLPSLTRGTMELLYEKDGMFVYKRVYEGETAIIAINNTSKSQTVALNHQQIVAGKELRGLLAGDLVTSNDDKYSIIIDRDEAEIYVLASQSGVNLPLVGTTALVVLLFIIFLAVIIKRSKQRG